jgi:hypothetical protein
VDACSRVNNQTQQLEGVDTVVTYGDVPGINVDEKCAAHYVNQDLPTFAFEIDFINQRRELSEGWLFNSNLKTDFYLLTWLWAIKDKDFFYEDITKARVIMLRRDKLISYLKNLGYTKTYCQQKSLQARSIRHNGVYERNIAGRPYFFLTQKLSEKPFNLVVPRVELVKIAELDTVIERKH